MFPVIDNAKQAKCIFKIMSGTKPSHIAHSLYLQFFGHLLHKNRDSGASSFRQRCSARSSTFNVKEGSSKTSAVNSDRIKPAELRTHTI